MPKRQGDGKGWNSLPRQSSLSYQKFADPVQFRHSPAHLSQGYLSNPSSACPPTNFSLDFFQQGKLSDPEYRSCRIGKIQLRPLICCCSRRSEHLRAHLLPLRLCPISLQACG